MTYIPVQGGLGNQLFVYAMAHYLKEFGLDVVLTFSEDAYNKGHRDNYLAKFAENCTHNITIKNGSAVNTYLRIADKMNSISHPAASAFKFLTNFVDFNKPGDFTNSKLKRAKLVRGFFQSNELVDKIWPRIKDEYAKTIELEHQEMIANGLIANLTKDSSYQCMHIRRGDYLENSKTLGVLSKDYFKRNALKEMPTIITTDTFNDLGFFEDFSDLLLLNHYDINPIQAISLMSYSSRLIMSNSTLSWWGSRLTLENGGTVIAPFPWFFSAENNERNILTDLRFELSESTFEL
jgi:hypothetical protein